MPALEDIKYDTIPFHMRDSVRDYIEKGRPVGDFLQSLICNKLKQTFRHADGKNLAAIHDWVCFIHNEMPGDACGDEKAYEHWCDVGGYKGHFTFSRMRALAREKNIELSPDELTIAKLSIGGRDHKREEKLRELQWLGEKVVGFSTPVYTVLQPGRACFNKLLELGVITRESCSYHF